MKATESGNFKPVPLPAAGTYVARCYSVIHVGTVPNIYEGKLNGTKEVVYITWEFPTLKAVFNDDKGLEPFVIGLELTLSTSDNSNLSKLVAQWRGKKFTSEEQKGFDPSIMLGKTCLINAIHKTKKKYEGETLTEITNANTNFKFNGIMARPAEMECPAMLNPSYVWDWEKDSNPFQLEKFQQMPKWLQTKLQESEEFKKFGAGKLPASSESDAAPAAKSAGKTGGDDGW